MTPPVVMPGVLVELVALVVTRGAFGVMLVGMVVVALDEPAKALENMVSVVEEVVKSCHERESMKITFSSTKFCNSKVFGLIRLWWIHVIFSSFQ